MIEKKFKAIFKISYAVFEEIVSNATGGAFDKIMPCPPKKIRSLERGIQRLEKRLDNLDAESDLF